MPMPRNYRLTLYLMAMRLANNIFFKEIEQMLASGETVKIKLLGHSMYPFLRSNKDSVVLSPFKKEDLKRGSVALFKYKDSYILHRIVCIFNDVYTFRGDGNVGLIERVHLDDIVALMTGIERLSGRKYSCNSFLWRTASCLWLLLSPFRRYLLWLCRVLKF